MRGVVGGGARGRLGPHLKVRGRWRQAAAILIMAE